MKEKKPSIIKRGNLTKLFSGFSFNQVFTSDEEIFINEKKNLTYKDQRIYKTVDFIDEFLYWDELFITNINGEVHVLKVNQETSHTFNGELHLEFQNILTKELFFIDREYNVYNKNLNITNEFFSLYGFFKNIFIKKHYFSKKMPEDLFLECYDFFVVYFKELGIDKCDLATEVELLKAVYNIVIKEIAKISLDEIKVNIDGEKKELVEFLETLYSRVDYFKLYENNNFYSYMYLGNLHEKILNASSDYVNLSIDKWDVKELKKQLAKIKPEFKTNTDTKGININDVYFYQSIEEDKINHSYYEAENGMKSVMSFLDLIILSREYMSTLSAKALKLEKEYLFIVSYFDYITITEDLLVPEDNLSTLLKIGYKIYDKIINKKIGLVHNASMER